MVLNIKSKTALSGFYVVYKGSTLLETEGIRGISHLSEHLKCKVFDHKYEQFDMDGISFNAYTSSNEIVFHITGLDKKLKKYKTKFLELLQSTNITEQEFQIEKKIVIEEYLESFNSQLSSHYLNLFRKKFGDFSPIGSLVDLKKMTLQDYNKFCIKQYSKPSMIINISKNSPFESDIQFSDGFFDNKLSYNVVDNLELDLNNSVKDKSSLILMSPIITKDYKKVNFINSMLTKGLASPFIKEIREKEGLVYSIGFEQNRYGESAVNMLYTLTGNENVDIVLGKVKMILDDRKQFLTKDRFNIIKDNMLVQYEKTEIERYKSIGKFVCNGDWSYEKAELKKLKYADILNTYDEYFTYDKFYISNDKKEF